MRLSNELQIGKAGEYLVCADLIMKGLVAFPSEQGLPYDVLVDTGKRLLKVQVKTTTAPRIVPQRAKDSYAYIFTIKRHGKRNTQIYDDGEVDIFALVCLDTRLVGYLRNEEMPTTVNFRVDSLRGTYYDEKGIQDYEKAVELSKTISNQSEIARQMNIHVSQVNRMLMPGYVPFQTNARYFSDIIRDAEWFDTL
jgi:hypothetical protein